MKESSSVQKCLRTSVEIYSFVSSPFDVQNPLYMRQTFPKTSCPEQPLMEGCQFWCKIREREVSLPFVQIEERNRQDCLDVEKEMFLQESWNRRKRTYVLYSESYSLLYSSALFNCRTKRNTRLTFITRGVPKAPERVGKIHTDFERGLSAETAAAGVTTFAF